MGDMAALLVGATSQCWRVVSGERSGGILVREGCDLKSPAFSIRLAYGALVRQVELRGERLHYVLVSGGVGPPHGWVSLASAGRPLVEAVDASDIIPSAAQILAELDACDSTDPDAALLSSGKNAAATVAGSNSFAAFAPERPVTKASLAPPLAKDTSIGTIVSAGEKAASAGTNPPVVAGTTTIGTTAHAVDNASTTNANAPSVAKTMIDTNAAANRESTPAANSETSVCCVDEPTPSLEELLASVDREQDDNSFPSAEELLAQLDYEEQFTLENGTCDLVEVQPAQRRISINLMYDYKAMPIRTDSYSASADVSELVANARQSEHFKKDDEACFLYWGPTRMLHCGERIAEIVPNGGQVGVFKTELSEMQNGYTRQLRGELISDPTKGLTALSRKRFVASGGPACISSEFCLGSISDAVLLTVVGDLEAAVLKVEEGSLPDLALECRRDGNEVVVILYNEDPPKPDDTHQKFVINIAERTISPFGASAMVLGWSRHQNGGFVTLVHLSSPLRFIFKRMRDEF